jgi:hypothetical protein
MCLLRMLRVCKVLEQGDLWNPQQHQLSYPKFHRMILGMVIFNLHYFPWYVECAVYSGAQSLHASIWGRGQIETLLGTVVPFFCKWVSCTSNAGIPSFENPKYAGDTKDLWVTFVTKEHGKKISDLNSHWPGWMDKSNFKPRVLCVLAYTRCRLTVLGSKHVGCILEGL